MESFTCIWTGIAYRSTIYCIYFLFLIVYHNWKHVKLSIPLKYKVLSKHKCCLFPFFLCAWDQRLRVVGYCFSPVCPSVMNFNLPYKFCRKDVWNFIFWGQSWYIKRHVRNVSARYMGNCSTKYAKGLLNAHFVIEKVGLKVYVKDVIME